MFRAYKKVQHYALANFNMIDSLSIPNKPAFNYSFSSLISVLTTPGSCHSGSDCPSLESLNALFNYESIGRKPPVLLSRPSCFVKNLIKSDYCAELSIYYLSAQASKH